jgi:hypothetical protein
MAYNVSGEQRCTFCSRGLQIPRVAKAQTFAPRPILRRYGQATGEHLPLRLCKRLCIRAEAESPGGSFNPFKNKKEVRICLKLWRVKTSTQFSLIHAFSFGASNAVLFLCWFWQIGMQCST